MIATSKISRMPVMSWIPVNLLGSSIDNVIWYLQVGRDEDKAPDSMDKSDETYLLENLSENMLEIYTTMVRETIPHIIH